MHATITDAGIYVTLSRRNLRQLQAMLEDPEHLNRCLARSDETGRTLIVQVQEDAEHYEGRDQSRGSGGLGDDVRHIAPAA